MRNVQLNYERSLFGMRAADCRSLARALGECETLIHLDLRGNLLEDDKARQLAAGLATNCTVTHLDLRHNKACVLLLFLLLCLFLMFLMLLKLFVSHCCLLAGLGLADPYQVWTCGRVTYTVIAGVGCCLCCCCRRGGGGGLSLGVFLALVLLVVTFVVVIIIIITAFATTIMLLWYCPNQ
jgi:hypothetical protein